MVLLMTVSNRFRLKASRTLAMTSLAWSVRGSYIVATIPSI